MEASREIFWNIGSTGVFLLYILAVLVVGVFLFALIHRIRLWQRGRPFEDYVDKKKQAKEFLYTALIEGILHQKLFRDPYAGFMHFFMFIGSLLLLVGTILDIVNHYIIPFLEGHVYLAISMAADIGGVLILIGVIMAIFRRYILKPAQLNSVIDDSIILTMIVVIILSGFFIEGFRMIAAIPEQLSEPVFYSRPDWAIWSFGGYFIASLFSGLPEQARVSSYIVLWWSHSIIVLAFIGYASLRFSKILHIFIGPINVFFRRLLPLGALSPIRLSETKRFGAGVTWDFTWKQLLDLDSCTNCGRCQNNCPAYLSGKSLSPMHIIQKLREQLNSKKSNKTSLSLIPEVITEEELWACTTCGTCETICPLHIEHIDKIIDMRRYVTLEEVCIPAKVEDTLISLENIGHPWNNTTISRESWAEGLNIPKLYAQQNSDTVFWVGCTSAAQSRSRLMVQTIASTLISSGMKLGSLGIEESCCGDPARRLGNEYLFQQQAKKNIELLNRYGVKNIICACPHCYNVLKNEYPQFGGRFNVLHHTEVFYNLLESGKLNLQALDPITVTYHDPCYLGKHNDIYTIPRKLLQSIDGLTLVEMDYNQQNSFCCGGGGGHLWIDRGSGENINEIRLNQAIDTKAEVIATACPWCLEMLNDALANSERDILIKDIGEIIECSIKQNSLQVHLI